MSFAKFMANPAGRIIRSVAGLALIAVGLTQGGALGVILGIVGLFLFTIGVVNVCVLAPLFGGPLSGKTALEAK